MEHFCLTTRVDLVLRLVAQDVSTLKEAGILAGLLLGCEEEDMIALHEGYYHKIRSRIKVELYDVALRNMYGRLQFNTIDVIQWLLAKYQLPLTNEVLTNRDQLTHYMITQQEQLALEHVDHQWSSELEERVHGVHKLMTQPLNLTRHEAATFCTLMAGEPLTKASLKIKHIYRYYYNKLMELSVERQKHHRGERHNAYTKEGLIVLINECLEIDELITLEMVTDEAKLRTFFQTLIRDQGTILDGLNYQKKRHRIKTLMSQDTINLSQAAYVLAALNGETHEALTHTRSDVYCHYYHLIRHEFKHNIVCHIKREVLVAVGDVLRYSNVTYGRHHTVEQLMSNVYLDRYFKQIPSHWGYQLVYLQEDSQQREAQLANLIAADFLTFRQATQLILWFEPYAQDVWLNEIGIKEQTKAIHERLETELPKYEHPLNPSLSRVALQDVLDLISRFVEVPLTLDELRRSETRTQCLSTLTQGSQLTATAFSAFLKRCLKQSNINAGMALKFWMILAGESDETINNTEGAITKEYRALLSRQLRLITPTMHHTIKRYPLTELLDRFNRYYQMDIALTDITQPDHLQVLRQTVQSKRKRFVQAEYFKQRLNRIKELADQAFLTRGEAVFLAKALNGEEDSVLFATQSSNYALYFAKITRYFNPNDTLNTDDLNRLPIEDVIAFCNQSLRYPLRREQLQDMESLTRLFSKFQAIQQAPYPPHLKPILIKKEAWLPYRDNEREEARLSLRQRLDLINRMTHHPKLTLADATRLVMAISGEPLSAILQAQQQRFRSCSLLLDRLLPVAEYDKVRNRRFYALSAIITYLNQKHHMTLSTDMVRSPETMRLLLAFLDPDATAYLATYHDTSATLSTVSRASVDL